MLASEKLFPIHEECKVTHYNAFGMESKLHNGDKDEEDDARPTKDQIGRIKGMIKTLKTIIVLPWMLNTADPVGADSSVTLTLGNIFSITTLRTFNSHHQRFELFTILRKIEFNPFL